MNFPGIWPAITTPFTADGAVYVAELRASVEWLIDAGVHGLVVTGTMGEFRALSTSEREQVTAEAIAAAGGRVPVAVGISADSADEARAYARAAESLGASGLMCLPPLSYRADLDELTAFFGSVASATGLPVMIYNNPSGSKNDLTPSQLAHLATLPNIAAVKETSEDVRRIPAILEATGGNIEVLVGGDDWALEGMCAGATGWVSGCAVVAPRECVELYKLIDHGALADARTLYMRLLPLARLDMDPKLVQLFKAAMDQVGRYGGPSRPPRALLSSADLRRVAEAVELLQVQVQV